MPMAGVTVAVKGISHTAISDMDGNYTIEAGPADTLIFSYIGFTTVSVPVNGRTHINISLKEDATALKEVTVNAGYYSVKDSERTGSIARIGTKEIEKQPVTNFLATMQGRMAGVNIIQNSGIPGAGFEIQIRGQNSLRLGGNSPMYIIDGIPYASDAIGSAITSPMLQNPTSPLNSINPSDIESIEILKDADATAIYGSRGANGVVLVTTKKGKKGGTRFTATASGGIGKVTRFRKLMDTEQYLAMRREAFANDGFTEYPESAYDVNGTWSQSRYTDWQKELFGGTASFSNYQASLSGGSENTQFLVSGNFSRETTVFPGDFKYDRAGVHSNITHESEDKKFRMVFSGSYAFRDNNQPAADLAREAITIAPNAPALYDAEGNLNWENNTFNNPLRQLETSATALTYDLFANTTLGYKLPYGFEVRSGLGFTDLRHREQNAQPSTVYPPAYGLGSESSLLFTTTTNRQSWIIEPQLNWNSTWGKTKLEALAGGTFQQVKGDGLTQMAFGFPSNALIYNPASASLFQVLSSTESVYRYQAFYGRINANYGKRYIVNLTARRDGSSRFGTANRFAWFGAVGAAWLFSDEALLKDNAILSFGKLRASYGTSGNDQIGDYQYLDTYSSGGSYQGITGLRPTRLFNPNFGWETNRKLEVALETGFLNDRIFTTIAWYRNRSSSQLVGIPLPGTTGFTSLQANLDAEVQNSGIEIDLRTVNIKSGQFSWTTNLNVTFARNKLLSFPGLESSPYKEQFVIGEPIGIIKAYHYTGLNPQTGVYQFEDVNGDGTITSPEDKKHTIDLSPEYYGGLRNQFTYGALQLDFLFQFVRQKNYNEIFGSGAPGTMVNQPAAAGQHWQNAGDTGPYQAYTSGSNGELSNAHNLYTESDAAVSDASFIRLKNIALSFDVPSQWTRNIKCRLSLQAQNLLTITSFRGADPEFSSPGFLPPLRMLTTSLQLTF